MKFAIFSLLMCAGSVALFAQQNKASHEKAQTEKNPVTAVLREMLPRQQKNLVEAAEEMPADKFSFKPTAAQMSFGDLVLHVAKSNLYMCSRVGGVAPPPSKPLPEGASKDALVDRLKLSFDFCNTVLNNLDDSKLGESVDLFGHQGTRAFALIALTNDWADHYAAAAMYLRLNGLLPPTAKK